MAQKRKPLTALLDRVNKERLAAERKVYRELEARKQELLGELNEIESYQSGLNMNGVSAPAKTTQKRIRTKRIRRTPEDLKKLADDVLVFIKSQKGGATGSSINQKFGMLIPSTKAFVQKWTGAKLRVSGKKQKTAYHA